MSYYLVFQEDLDDTDPYVELKSVAKAAEKLAEIAEEIGVRTLRSFVYGEDRGHEDLQEIAENEGWGGVDYQTSATGEEWFDASDALDTVRALMGYIQSDPSCLKRPKATTEELRGLETALEVALQAGVRFRLERDE
jgi:hypothetical protein